MSVKTKKVGPHTRFRIAFHHMEHFYWLALESAKKLKPELAEKLRRFHQAAIYPMHAQLQDIYDPWSKNMKTTKVSCDQCGADLTTTGNCEDYRIALINESIPSWDGVVTDMALYPHLEQNYHFCDYDCLRTWFFAQNPPKADPQSPSNSKKGT